MNKLKIGIAGAGGIGSNVCNHLIRTNISNLKIVDFDILERSNLNRQYYFYDQLNTSKVEALKINMERINPQLNLEIINTLLTEENIVEHFQDCDIIIEAFDNKSSKRFLVEQLFTTKKLIISASGIAGLSLANVKVKRFADNLYVVGDFTTDIDTYKTYSSKVSYVASIMANLAIEYLEVL